MTAARRILRTLDLPGSPASAKAAREAVRAVRHEHPELHGLDVYDLQLCADELAGNAVRHTASGHAGGRLIVELALLPASLRLTVIDQGGAFGKPQVDENATGETGRGLKLVSVLARRWGFDQKSTGTAVWCEFDL
jgi:anti-sigma regulatory factor (Ser/Thr protein kinase)